MREEIEQAFEPVRRDLLAWDLPLPLVWEAVDEDLSEWAEGIEILGYIDGNNFSFMTHDSVVDRIAILADKTQEWVIEDVLWPSKPTNWPPCPEHPESHPLEPKVAGSNAVWVCPTQEIIIAHVGSLAPLTS